MNSEDEREPSKKKEKLNPSQVIPNGKDVWSLIIKSGVLTKQDYYDDYERLHTRWIGLEHLKSLRAACKPMRDALTKINLNTNDYFKTRSLRGAMNFKKCFPKTTCSFQIGIYKYGDWYGYIYLGPDLEIVSMQIDGNVILPLDTSDGNNFVYDISNYHGITVIKSSFFKETLYMIMTNGGLPEGVHGFVYETCVLSESSMSGIDTISIFVNDNLDFATIRAESWNRNLELLESPEEIARRERERLREREREASESDSDSDD